MFVRCFCCSDSCGVNTVQVIYVVSDVGFFCDGYSGKVRHAQGVVSGLAQNGIEVKVLAASGAAEYIGCASECAPRLMSFIPNQFLKNLYLSLIILAKVRSSSSRVVIVRKNIALLVVNFFSFGVFFRSKAVVWEINGLSGLDLRHSICKEFVLRLLHRFALRSSRGYAVNEVVASQINSWLLDDNRKIKTIANGSPELKQRAFKLSKNKITLVYFGKFQLYNDFHRVASWISKGEHLFEIDCIIVGHGPQQRKLEEIAMGNPRITLLGAMSPSEFSALDALSDRCVGLIPLDQSPRSEILSPIKFYEYCALGLPVITIGASERDPLGAFALFADCRAEFLEALSVLLDNKVYVERANSAINFASENSWQRRMSDVLDLLHEA